MKNNEINFSLSPLCKVSPETATRGTTNNEINTPDSRVFADASHKNDSKVCESGRSMTEMLGVLAIIGVLSVGAIGGYSYAMDKHKANQTMRDISLRTVDLMTQASQGRAELSFAEWNNEDTIYDFTNPAYVEGENLIAFDVGANDKIPQRVCEMVFDGLASTAVQIDINAVHSNSNEDCGTDNTMTFYFEGGRAGTPDTGGETPTGEQCGGTVCGTCQKCYSATETCVTVADYETKCTADGQSGWCVSGTCEPDTTCNCGAGQYCADTNEDAYTPHPSECKDLDFRTVDIDGTIYYISNNIMSWWDAVSFCQVLGTDGLVSIDDLISGWDGVRFAIRPRTVLMEALYSEWGDIAVWTKDLCSDDVCSVSTEASVYNLPRNYSQFYNHAVCR